MSDNAGQHQRRPQEARRHRPVGIPDEPCQRVADHRAVVVRSDAQAQGRRAPRLCGQRLVTPACPGPRGDIPREPPVVPGRVGVAEEAGGVGREPGTVGEERVRKERRVGLGDPRPVDRSVRVQPVAELERWSEQAVALAPRDEGVHPSPHARELTPDDVGVAV